MRSLPKRDQPLRRQPLQHVGRDALLVQLGRPAPRAARRAAASMASFWPRHAARSSSSCPCAVRAAMRMVLCACVERHGGGQRIACPARVVLGHPQREIDHGLRQKGLVVEHFDGCA